MAFPSEKGNVTFHDDAPINSGFSGVALRELSQELQNISHGILFKNIFENHINPFGTEVKHNILRNWVIAWMQRTW